MAEPGEAKSKLYALKPLVDRLPAVTRPEKHVHFRTKMMWTILILLFYFCMTNVMLYGLESKGIDLFTSFRAIMAGAQGSLLHLGIGPIVTGSIIMQLFVGAKIIKLDLKNDEDKAVYQGTQKLVVIIMIIVESVPQVFGYLEPSKTFVATHGLWIARGVIIAQLFVGSYLIFLMDEVVSKWGLGSGISLFIAAGVSQSIFTGAFNWLPSQSVAIGIDNPPIGTIPKTAYLYTSLSAADLSRFGYEQILFQPPNPMIALIGTIAIFLLVAYVESCRIELPLAHERARGARGRYPIRLLYASVIPVILMAALLANVSMFSLLFWHSWKGAPLLGGQWWLGYFPVDPQTNQLVTRPTAGLAWYLSSFNGVQDWLLPIIWPHKYATFAYVGGFSPAHPHAIWQVGVRVLVYTGVMVIGCIFFAKFWIETTNMGAGAVAKQIQSSGMHIPGFRRDPRILESVLNRYIPAVTVFSGAGVGLLAVGADLIGTTGNVSGTGVLLAVSVMINFFEAIGREQMMEMHPVLRKFFAE